MGSRVRVAVLLALCAAAASGCWLAPSDALLNPDGAPATLTTLFPGLMIVEGTINGNAARILIDTGSPFGVTSAAHVGQYGLTPSAFNPFDGQNAASDACSGDLPAGPFLFSAAQVILGGFEFANSPFIVVDRFPPELNELQVDAVLGASMMNQLDWEITDGGQTLKLYSAGTFERPATAIDLLIVDINLPLWGVRIATIALTGGFRDGAPLPLILDTAYSGKIATTNQVATLNGLDDPSLPSTVLPVASWSSVCLGRSVRFPDSRLGERTFANLRIDVLPTQGGLSDSYYGLVGWTLLAAHHTRCSPRGGWIDLEETPDTAAALAAKLPDFGFVPLRREDGRLEVRLVIEGSTAQQAGLLVGDIIERIDGVSVVGVSLFQLLPLAPMPGQALTLDIVRLNGVPVTIPVTAAEGI
ncbi:MAG: aspartyl protease family protein [Phycisphaerae bacterium]|nr:aspartyl protease family protein [Phycisphaerae bacterium]